MQPDEKNVVYIIKTYIKSKQKTIRINKKGRELYEERENKYEKEANHSNVVLCQVLFGTTYLVAADEADTDIIVKNDDSGISDTKLYEVLL